MTETSPGLFWLTRDFRFDDNPALLAALSEGPLLPVFVVDAALKAQGSASRWRLGRALAAFDAELRRRSGGQGVVVLEGEAEAVLPPLMAASGAGRVHQSDWPTAAMRAVQARLSAKLAPEGRELILHPGHLLIHPRMVRTGQGGSYRVYTPFARALRAVGPDRPAAPAPARLRLWHDVPGGADLATLDLAPDMYRGRNVLDTFALAAGEAQALARLEAFFDRAAGYGEERDRPDIDATSGLSEHLATGEISPRRIWALASARAEADPRAAAGIGTFLSELIWREFSWHLLIAFPQMDSTSWRPEWQDFPWRGESAEARDWLRAETGIGLVDAGLREMRVTGRMHNRVRMVVASWLTKHLLTDWRIGLAHFEDSLTDWDPAANAMNWQWVAGCGPDAAPYFRIFNPETQAKQYDPQARYRRRWLAGWAGAPGPEARAYLDSVPPGWKIRPIWREGASDKRLKAGREAALAAYARFRKTDEEA